MSVCEYIYICFMWKQLGDTFGLDFSAFERTYAYSVFKDKSVLSPSYIPSKLVCRKSEEFELAKILFVGVKDGVLQPMVRVFGKP